MSEYDELVTTLRTDYCRCVGASEYKPVRCYTCEAADAIEALVGEVENQKCFAVTEQQRAEAAEAEVERLKEALEALSAARSDLPEKVSEEWLYEGVRHWHRNCDWDEPRDGSPLDRGDGATVAKLVNMIPRSAIEAKP